MKRALVVLGLALTLPAQARTPADADYLPLAVGARWTYVSSDGHEVVETVSGSVQVKDEAGRLMATAAQITAADGEQFFLVPTAKGVVRFYDPPSSASLPSKERVTWVLRFPLHHGSHWESWTPAGKVEFRVTDKRSLPAPDGSLVDGVRVDFVSLPEPIFAGHIWYARGIGAVEIVEGDYTRKLLGYRPGDGIEVPVAKRLAGLEPPSVAENFRLGRKGWVAIVLIATAAAGVLLIPRLRRPIRAGAWERAAEEEEKVQIEEEGSLSVQAARLEASITSHPTYADLRCKLGAVYVGLEKIDEAVAQFRKALELNPRYVEAGLGLTRALQTAGRFADAIAAIRPFSERHPNYADVQNLLGEALAGAGDSSAAMAAYRRALAINPNYEVARRNVEKLEGAAASNPAEGQERERADKPVG